MTAKTTNRIGLKGLLGSADPELALRAEWTSDDGDQRIVRRSTPLESLDAAIPLLKAWHGNDASLASMTDWTPVSN